MLSDKFSKEFELDSFTLPSIYPKDPSDFIKEYTKEELKQIIKQYLS